MDVSFTNVLEGARQYFQGLPVPSTGGATVSTDHNLATSTSSTSSSSTSSSHDHGTASTSVASPSPAPPAPPLPPPLSLSSQSSSSSATSNNNNDQETSRYRGDNRPSSVDANPTTSSNNSFWSPPVEPYPPQPTRVEVPDTRPGEDGTSVDASPSSSSIITLTEMQPSSGRTSATCNLSQKHSTSSTVTTTTSSASLSNDRHQQGATTTVNGSSQLHQMQPPRQSQSPGPVYQQLNPVTRTSFSTAEILASSHQTTYQTANDRPSQSSVPVPAQRTQYYPRYHHPDITKSAPVPFSQNSIYQSSSAATATSSGNVQPVTRPTPVEQTNPGTVPGQGNAQEQRVPASSSYGGNVVPSTNIPSIYGSPSPQGYRTPHHHQAQNRSSSASTPEKSHHSERTHHSSRVSSSPSCSSINPCSPRHTGNNMSHIPSSPSSSSSSSTSSYHNLPAHISTSHLPAGAMISPHQQQQQQQPSQVSQMQHQQQQLSSRMNASPHSAIGPSSSSYSGRMMGHATSTGSSSSGSSSQMPPPQSLGGYHPVASPHDVPRHATPSPHRQSPHVSTMHNPHASPHQTPSPHNSFQPHSPTYPPPPPPPPPAPATSTPHSYSLPITSQPYHQASTTGGYATNPYGLPPQSSYHSYQKNPQPTYYPQSSRSQTQPYAQQLPMPGPTPTMCSGSGNNSGGYHHQQQHQQQKPVTYNGADSKRNSTDTSYGSYRPSQPSIQRPTNTHNLPPIAALSSYHSNRQKSASRAQSIQRQRCYSTNTGNKVPLSTPPTSTMAAPQRVPEYSVSLPAVNHMMPLNGRITAVTNSSYSRYSGQHGYPSYATTMAPSHQGSNSSSSTTVTSVGVTTSGSTAPVATTVVHGYPTTESGRMSSSYHPQPIRANEEYGYKDYSYQNSTAAIPVQTSVPASAVTPPPQTNGIRKRESPLDLSVKTVKTSADSTAQDDVEILSTEKHVTSSTVISSRNNNSSRTAMLPPPVQPHPPPQPGSHPSYENRLPGNRSLPPTSGGRISTGQTVCAPKVDFLPDFNSTPLRHHHGQPSTENTLQRRSSTQQLYVPPPAQHPNNTAPLPHMSTFKKSSLPTTQVYDAVTAPTPPSLVPSSSSSSYLMANDSSASRAVRYPILDTGGLASAALPVQEYPSDPSKYYLNSRSKFGQLPPPQKDRNLSKRPGETIYGAGGPNKQPRLDTWIQQKLSTARALYEQQKRQEMNLPVPLPNGTLVAPNAYEQRSDNGYSSTESSRYQQAYCDKRSYAEPKISHGSSSYPTITKPSNVHSLPGQQSSYVGYRERQKNSGMTTGGVGPTSGGQSAEQPPSNTGADKRVLSLLRNSLENKQQREEQMNSQQPSLANHSHQSFQNKVVAPVEPKTNIGRHNLSPFTAASLLERNSNTPPNYKFHVPRAVDSITQEAPRSLYASRVNSSATLPGKEALLGPRGGENQIHRDKDDGLAAILAAKIRTKAELKQVGTGQFGNKPTSIPSQDASSTPKDIDSAASTSTPQSGSSVGSPPKLTREKAACLPPRRRLFSRTEEENMPVAATVPVPAPAPAIASSVPARASGFRSSSETSVFDFRESDSEGEMPVLERQTLEEMRRDRKQLSKVQPPVPLNDAMCMGMTSSSDLVKIELKENDKINEVDAFWSTTCDKFMEQLRTGDGVKKRGRKKKMISCTVTSKLDDTGNESSKESDANVSRIKPEDVKKEVQDVGSPLDNDKDESPETSKDEETSIVKEIKVEVKVEEQVVKEEEKNTSDEDEEPEVVPPIRRSKRKVRKDDSDCDEEIICRKRRIRRGSRIKLQSSSGSESSSEESDASTEFGHGSSVADRLRARKRCANNNTEPEGMKLRSRDTTPQKAKVEKETKCSGSKSSANSQKGKPKPLFGDGSDFRPGWEEEVYVYKKSLRMPPRLITVSKPSRFHRLSTSLPDLDPGSPTMSVSMDSSDVCLSRKKIVDSDVESNYSFSITGIGVGSKIEDEEATSSTTISCPPKTMKHSKSEGSSIVDVLAQKVGTSKKDQKKKLKEKADKGGGKTLLKGSNEPELLPTPSLTPLLETSKLSKGKSPMKNNKSLKPIKVTDSFLLGYFRKETVNNFRDTFKNNHALPNEFSTLVLKSRTRTETRVLKKQATIREVFGEDRPASAPPMQNHDDTSQDDDSQNETADNALSKERTLKQKVVSRLKNAGILRSHKAIMNSKRLLMAKRQKDLLKSLAEKKLKNMKTEVEEEAAQEETNDAQDVENNELDDETNESEIPNKKKLKLRTSRRKFRSGFDYIRKKKKPLKKDEALPKERKRQVLTRPSPECVADIQSEIRTWVIKKGVGETMLHRAARLGYTDVTAYCLEKLNNAPSPKDNAGYTPLHEACSKGHLEIAKLLLAYGANASESANGGIRPLHEAAENGATELVRLLLSYGADPLLATYSGQTPLMLAADTDAYSILEQHLDDIQGRASIAWSFGGPSSIFDPEETGYNPVDDPPIDSPEPELDEVEMEMSDVNLPVLFSLSNDPDKWVLLQDLMAALRIKSRDALLRQVNPKAHAGPPAIAHRDVMRELKLQDFLEQSRCCHLLSGGERINVRGSKVTLIKYSDKVRSLLNVENVMISLR